MTYIKRKGYHIRLQKSVYEKIQELAVKEERPVYFYIEKVLKQHLENFKKK